MACGMAKEQIKAQPYSMQKPVYSNNRCLQSRAVFQNGQQLPTLYKKNNLTVRVNEVNNTNSYIIQSPASAGRIISGPYYACNVSVV